MPMLNHAIRTGVFGSILAISQAVWATSLTGVITSLSAEQGTIRIDQSSLRLSDQLTQAQINSLGIGERVQVELSGYEVIAISPQPDRDKPVLIRSLTNRLPQ